MRSCTAAIALSLVAAAPASAQPSEAKSWPTPWERTRPRDPFVDREGHVWFVGQGATTSRGSIPIPVDGPNAIRHVVFDAKSRQIWFGGDANMIGRVNVSPTPPVP